MKSVIFLFSLLLTFQCFASGYVSIDGKTSDGWTVVFDQEPPAKVWIWKEGAERESSVQSFEGHCKNMDRGFECDSEDQSPLSGTKYELHHVGSCKVDNEYVCVEGCIKNRRAPKTMTQGYWEGDPYCGMSQEAIAEAERMDKERKQFKGAKKLKGAAAN